MRFDHVDEVLASNTCYSINVYGIVSCALWLCMHAKYRQVFVPVFGSVSAYHGLLVMPSMATFTHISLLGWGLHWENLTSCRLFG